MTHPTGVPLASLWSPWRLHGCSSGLHCCSFCALTISPKEYIPSGRGRDGGMTTKLRLRAIFVPTALSLNADPSLLTMALLRHNIKGLSTKPPYTNTPPNNPHPLYPKIPHPFPIMTPMSPSESQLSPPELPPASREIKVDVLSHASPPDDRGTRAGGNLTSIIFFRIFSFHSFSLGR